MTALEEIIHAEIRARGPMRFDRFMETALYHPEAGYYAKSGPSPIGHKGDFYTSVSAGPLFGRLLARQFLQMWTQLGKPGAFWIMEQGAHDARLACDILEWCRAETPEFFASIRYGIVQGNGELRNRQMEMLSDYWDHANWFENLDELAAKKPVGVYFSNELVDAFPVHSIIFRDSRWLEQYVGIHNGQLCWVDQPISDPELRYAIDSLPLPEIDGYVTEINLLARTWIDDVANALARGYVLTIDYGYPARAYYAAHRTSGTLTAYVKHEAIADVLAEPGQRDITAHVDFTSLARAGEKAGLTTLGFLDQQHFLMGLAHDELAGAPGPVAKIPENKTAWNTLTHPEHLGATFFALLQAKDAPVQLDGLRFARKIDL